MQQDTEVPNHGLPGHIAVCYQLDLDQFMQRVAKLRKLSPFSLPPQEQKDTAAVLKILLKPHLSKWHAMIDAGAPIDELWSLWTFVAEETGLALSCDDLNEDTATPLSTCPPGRGEGARYRCNDPAHYLGPTKTTRNGASARGSSRKCRASWAAYGPLFAGPGNPRYAKNHRRQWTSTNYRQRPIVSASTGVQPISACAN